MWRKTWSDGMQAISKLSNSSSEISKIGLSFLLFFVWGVNGCMADQLTREGTREERLAPCPGSSNCVSTQSEDPKRAMPPLPYIGSRQESMDRLLGILKEMQRTKIVVVRSTYVHAEFRSWIFGFVDDVEFSFDDSVRLVHFRSASRSGYYDFGVNRNRMKQISDRYLLSGGEKDR